MRRALLSGFLALYALTLLLMNCPREWKSPQVLLRPLVPALDFLGLYLYLPLFSPDPPAVNAEVEIDVLLEGQRIEVWPYWPESDDERTVQLYKRYANLYFRDSRRTPLMVDFARYVVRRALLTGRKPLEVTFYELSRRIPTPEEGAGQLLLPPYDRREVMYRYRVTAGDLR